MDQSMIDQRAAAIFERHRQELLGNILKFRLFSVVLKRAGLAEAGQVSTFFVVIAGDSLKAARYRELTGKSFPAKHLECVPVGYAGADELRQEWMKWTGETPSSLDSGSVPIIIFVGGGHSVFGLDPVAEQLENLESWNQELQAFLRSERHALLTNPDDWFQSLDDLAKTMSARFEDFRSPKLAP